MVLAQECSDFAQVKNIDSKRREQLQKEKADVTERCIFGTGEFLIESAIWGVRARLRDKRNRVVKSVSTAPEEFIGCCLGCNAKGTHNRHEVENSLSLHAKMGHEVVNINDSISALIQIQDYVIERDILTREVACPSWDCWRWIGGAGSEWWNVDQLVPGEKQCWKAEGCAGCWQKLSAQWERLTDSHSVHAQEKMVFLKAQFGVRESFFF